MVRGNLIDNQSKGKLLDSKYESAGKRPDVLQKHNINATSSSPVINRTLKYSQGISACPKASAIFGRTKPSISSSVLRSHDITNDRSFRNLRVNNNICAGLIKQVRNLVNN